MKRPEPWRRATRTLWRGVAAAAFIGFFVNLLYLALPLYQSQIFDRVITSGNMDTLVALTLIVAIVFVFQAMLDLMRSRLLTILAGQFSAALGRPVFEAAVESSLKTGGNGASLALRDVNGLRGFVASGAIVLPMDLLFTPVLVTVLLLLHPLYGLVGVAGALLLTAAALATELLARRPAARAMQASAAHQTETASAIRNAEVIAAMGMLPAIATRWRRGQSRSLDSVEEGSGVAKLLAALARGMRTGLQLAVICTGAWLVVGQQVSPGTIMAATVITSRLLAPFEHLIDGWRQWVNASAAHARLRDVLAQGGHGRSQVPLPIGRADLVVDRLSYIPPGQEAPILRNVTFRIGPGEMVGVIGPSGSGKSSLARMVIGLWQPTTGGIFLDGQSTYRHERASFGEAVGYLPQESLLLDGTVRENISRFRDAPMEEVVAAARQAGVHAMIGQLPRGYETRLVDAGARLSGGQRQRIALARAVFGAPKLLVLDEPNSALDADGESALIAAIEVARAGGAAVLVVAQRMSVLNKADRLLMLRDGAVAQYGDKREVLEGLRPQRQAPGMAKARLS